MAISLFDRFIAAAALLCAVFLSGCQTAGVSKAVASARITGASVQALSLQKVDLLFDVEITNPSEADLPLRDLSYKIAAEGQVLIEDHVAPNAIIPANGRGTIQVPASIRYAAVLGILKNVRPGSVLAYTADIMVGTDAPLLGAVRVPISYRGELPIPAVPDVRLVGFDVDALSFDRVAASLRLHIRNNNEFDIDLERLGRKLALGGKSIGDTTQPQSLKLRPGEAVVVSIPIAFSPRSLGIGAFNVLIGREAPYGVVGSVDVETRFGMLTLPFNEKGYTPIY